VDQYECTDLVRMWGYDASFHVRPDGKIDVLQGWAGHPTEVRSYPNMKVAVIAVHRFVYVSVRQWIRRIEEANREL